MAQVDTIRVEAIFAWDWTVAYRSARVHAGRDRLRYRVFRQADPDSPTGYRWTWEPGKPVDQPCPVCGSPTEVTLDCPSYKSTYGGWMRCQPPQSCGDARRYDCTRKGCGWYFATGYAWENPNNARLLPGRGVVPEWLSEQ